MHSDVTKVGLLLSSICIVYTAVALPIGWLTDKALQRPSGNGCGATAGCHLRLVMIVGWVVTLAAAVLLAPGGGGGDLDDESIENESLWPLSPLAAKIALESDIKDKCVSEVICIRICLQCCLLCDIHNHGALQ